MNIALVTGASSGIGREFAFQLAVRFRFLDEVWVIARREDRLIELEKQIPKRLRILAGDITKAEFLQELSDKLRENNACIRFLVNSAGYGKIDKIGKINLKDELGMIDLNCKALTAVTHIALPYLRAKSIIFNIASAAAFMPQPDFAVYAATKAYVHSYTLALSKELENRRIRVVSVCPGPVNTEFFEVANSTEMDFYKRISMAEPDNVVSNAIFDALKNNNVSVHGILMKIFRILAKLLPLKILFKILQLIR